jgi:hypothetical protein
MYFTGKMGRDKLMKRQTEREGGGGERTLCYISKGIVNKTIEL